MESIHRHYQTIGSTNDAARAWACDTSTPAPHGAIVSADEQTAGHGRRGRDWVSPHGKGLYLSVVWRPTIEVAHLGRLTIIAALATARAIEEISGLSAQTKWPNDVLIAGRKVAGILCDVQLAESHVDFVIVGVGLNLNFTSTDLPERPLFPATSLLMESGHEYSSELARALLYRHLQQEYSAYLNGDWNVQRGEFIARNVLIGQHVQIAGEGTEHSGVAVGVDNEGLLIVQNSNGLRSFAAGDVSLIPST